MHVLPKALAAVVVLLLTACAANDPNRGAKTGAAVGGAAGAVLGHQVGEGSGKGTAAGAVVGAIAGAIVGNYMDRQRQDLEQSVGADQGVTVQPLPDDTLRLDLESEITFDFDSARIKGEFLPTLDRISDVLTRYPNTVVHVVGHTDSMGSEDYNQGLSERRAAAVARELMANGVRADRLRTQGMGERQPRASNDTAQGRAANRRVELFVKPVVEGREAEAYISPYR
jgi:outer membrane protein OmpA-like peptidoglycan-associated protein